MQLGDEIRAAYEQRRPLLVDVAKRLEARMLEALEDVPHVDRVSFRAKKTDSFCRKCIGEDGQPLRESPDSDPHYKSPLEEVEDQVAGRILVLYRDNLEVVEAIVRQWFPAAVEVTRKRPTATSSFGYESNHYIFVIDEHMKPDGWDAAGPMPATFELQIRTLFMHAYAEPQHEIGYKAGTEPDEEIDRQFAWIAASAWGADRTMNDLYRQIVGTAQESQ
jgi:ppGpp synthetase/RelA/SpoT-type nucleotidyltranferase